MQKSVFLNRIYWIIHPYCWSMHDTIPSDRDPVLWKANVQRELHTHELHMDFVSNVQPDEALIIYPIADSEPMLRLIAHAQDTLGPRCFVEDRSGSGVGFLEGVEDPIRRFLDDEELPGRREFIHDMLTSAGTRDAPAGLAEEIEAEIREACSVIGYDWSHQALKVIYFSRMIAYDIEETFRQRGLSYDPAKVDCLACGEGFEQCAMTWKGMLPHYLGLAKPIENDFRMSVSGAPYLVKAELRERVHVSDTRRVFLWDAENGERIGFLCKAAVRLRDPQLFAHIRCKGLNVEIRDIPNELHWPVEDPSRSIFPMRDDSILVPVFAATRKGGNPPDRAFYLIAPNMPYEDFRSLLVEAEVTSLI